MTDKYTDKGRQERPNARVTAVHSDPGSLATAETGRDRESDAHASGARARDHAGSSGLGTTVGSNPSERERKLGDQVRTELDNLAGALSQKIGEGPKEWSNPALGELGRWTALIGGGALAVYGLRRSLGSLTIAGIGAGLVYRALTGQSPLTLLGGGRDGQRISSAADAVQHRAGSLMGNLSRISQPVTKSIIVKADLTDAYQAWTNFENYPRFMPNIKSVTKTGEKTTHWEMEGPFNLTLEWDAEITRLEENKRIAWNSIESEGNIKTSGQVTFNALPDGQLEVTVTLKYVPPAGLAGGIAAELFGNPEGKLITALRNFKAYMENRNEGG